jgi:hypothetical protein
VASATQLNAQDRSNSGPFDLTRDPPGTYANIKRTNKIALPVRITDITSWLSAVVGALGRQLANSTSSTSQVTLDSDLICLVALDWRLAIKNKFNVNEIGRISAKQKKAQRQGIWRRGPTISQ